MEDWKIFEKDCLDYLKEIYSSNNFELKGQSDSTISDIEVILNNNKHFFIEIKMPKAQSGQFVIIKNENKFEFSKQNKSKENGFTIKIIEFINSHFDEYKDIGSKSKEINIDSKIFYDWIVKYYTKKNVEFIITQYNSKFIIFPIKNFNKYFNIKGNLRCKKSGSSKIPEKNFLKVFNFLKENDSEIQKIEDKRIIISEKFKHKYKFEVDGDFYQLSELSEQNIFEIRKLGKTNNPTVIFSIITIREQDLTDLDCFKNFIS